MSDFQTAFQTADGDAAAKAAALDEYLYGYLRFRLPTAAMEIHSPYRTYYQIVLAQRVGVKPTLALIHLAVLLRLQQKGALPESLEVALPPGSATLPYTRVRGSNTMGEPACARALILQTLDLLARAFWSWPWTLDAPSGFLSAARAASGQTGRLGTVVGGVVMHVDGRPFGSIQMATLQMERLAALGKDTASRDLAVLLAHSGRKAEALRLLRAYAVSPAGRLAAEAQALPANVMPSLLGLRADAAEEAEALGALTLELERDALESALRMT